MPHLVRNILERDLNRAVVYDHTFSAWQEIHLQRGSGYARKLQLEIVGAADDGYDGVVATVDRDKAKRRSRLKNLEQGREAARARGGTLPTAIGEADPHGEAWLVADWNTLLTTLRLPATSRVTGRKPPKDLFLSLLASSPRREEDPVAVMTEIARTSDPGRIAHRPSNGFSAFAEEVMRALRPLFGG